MPKVIRKFYPNEVKCGGCNWRVSVLYSFEDIDIDKYGLCGSCFMDMIVEEGFVVKKEKKKE